MRKIKLKKRRKVKTSTKISTIIVFLIIGTYIFINYCGKSVLPTIMKEAKIDCKKMAISVIKNSLNDEVLKTLDDNMYNIVQNNNGEIQTIDFNPIIVNRFLTKTTGVVTNNLKKLETSGNGVITEIPMGIITNNVLLSNLGPKVPVKINLVGSVVSNIETKVRNYGINNAMIEIVAKVEVTEEVIIPFQTETIKITNEVPVAIKIINGTVPEYFSNGKLTESSNILSIPIENE